MDRIIVALLMLNRVEANFIPLFILLARCTNNARRRPSTKKSRKFPSHTSRKWRYAQSRQPRCTFVRSVFSLYNFAYSVRLALGFDLINHYVRIVDMENYRRTMNILCIPYYFILAPFVALLTPIPPIFEGHPERRHAANDGHFGRIRLVD